MLPFRRRRGAAQRTATPRQSRPIAWLGALPIKSRMKSFQDRSRKGRNTLVLKLFFLMRGRNLRNEPAFLCRATNVPCLAVSVSI